MNPNKPRQPGTKRTLTDRLEAALAWVITGTCQEAEKLCGIPARTISGWMAEDSWSGFVEEARKLKQEELDTSFTKVIHKAIKELDDRLDNGDEIMAKDGSMTKRRVPAKDAAFIASILSDKRAVLRGTPTSITKREGGTADKLKDLKEGLEYVDAKSRRAKDSGKDLLN